MAGALIVLLALFSIQIGAIAGQGCPTCQVRPDPSANLRALLPFIQRAANQAGAGVGIGLNGGVGIGVSQNPLTGQRSIGVGVGSNKSQGSSSPSRPGLTISGPLSIGTAPKIKTTITESKAIPSGVYRAPISSQPIQSSLVNNLMYSNPSILAPPIQAPSVSSDGFRQDLSSRIDNYFSGMPLLAKLERTGSLFSGQPLTQIKASREGIAPSFYNSQSGLTPLSAFGKPPISRLGNSFSTNSQSNIITPYSSSMMQSGVTSQQSRQSTFTWSSNNGYNTANGIQSQKTLQYRNQVLSECTGRCMTP